MLDLSFINLFGNDISEVHPLSELTQIDFLDLRENPLSRYAYKFDLETIYKNNNGGIDYSPFSTPTTGVKASDGIYPGRVRITWDTVPNGPLYISHYKVFRADRPGGDKEQLNEWQASNSFDDITAIPGKIYYYQVQNSASDQGLSESMMGFSESGWASQSGRLTTSSTAGGTVTIPEEGISNYTLGSSTEIQANSSDPNLFFFVSWTGTAVDEGLVTDPNQASSTVLITGVHTLKANFASVMSTLYVNKTRALEQPTESGTQTSPFDSIQKAIDVALAKQVTIYVYPGTYYENIDFQ